MATLTADNRRSRVLGNTAAHGAVASDVIYEGAAVGDNGSGYARPLVAGDPFLGFAVNQCDNAAGSAGDKDVQVDQAGCYELSVGSLAITDVGKDVYASDDDTFTLTEGSNTRIGRVVQFISSGKGVVEFCAAGSRVTGLTDNSGGTASDTLAVISDGATANAIASLAAKVNTLLIRTGGGQ